MAICWAMSRASGNLQGAWFDSFVEALPFDERHCNERAAVGLLDGMDRADVGVIERGGCFRFPLEALAAFFILEQVGGEEFQRYGAVELGVLGFVDNTHPAFTEFFGDSVVANGLADALAEETWRNYIADRLRIVGTQLAAASG